MSAGRKRPSLVLATVAVLLIASGTVRVIMGAGPAIAYAEEQLKTDQDEPVAEVPAPAPVSDLVAALQAREVRIEEREQALADRLQALSIAEEEIIERLQQLEAAEASLAAALALSQTAADDDIARLTSVYENMKPADAAALFEEMAPEFASGFLVRMRPEAAAAIFAGLEPQTAYSISVLIAGRNANAPTE